MGGVVFGDDVNCARNMYLIDCNHGYKRKDILINKQEMECERIVIGNNVWIGVNTTIIKGAKIGNGTVVGACSLVNKHFPDDCVIGGVPAKILLYR